MGKGLIHIYTGEGKGKTTAAIGLAVRAAGQGKRVLFAQFFKDDRDSSGEKELFKDYLPMIELIRSNVRHPIFTKGRTDKAALEDSISRMFNTIRERIKNNSLDLLVLDEINSVIRGEWLSLDDILLLLRDKPERLEVVLTGREANVELVKIADYATEMLKIKHPFDKGIKARKGIEY
jgi:cob(I)alamin adenosyltransferase